MELSHKIMDAGDMIIMVTDGIIDSMAGDEPGDRVFAETYPANGKPESTTGGGGDPG